jgi:hypothetical protein
MEIIFMAKWFGWMLAAFGITCILSVVVVFFGTAIGPNGTSMLGTTKTVSGVVSDVYEAGAFDAVFEINNSDTSYYINRGLEDIFTLNQLKELTLHKKVSISYVSQTSLLGGGASLHINRLVVGDSVLYDEMKGIPGMR